MKYRSTSNHSPVVTGALTIHPKGHVIVGAGLTRKGVGVIEDPGLGRRLLKDEQPRRARPAGLLEEILAPLVLLQEDLRETVSVCHTGLALFGHAHIDFQHSLGFYAFAWFVDLENILKKQVLKPILTRSLCSYRPKLN